MPSIFGLRNSPAACRQPAYPAGLTPQHKAIHKLLAICDRYGHLLLVASLLLGLTSQTLAGWVRPHIDWLIVALLLVASIRIGPATALRALGDFRIDLPLALGLQLVLPMLLLLVVRLAGFTDPLWPVLVLLFSAPPIAGGPHLVSLLGADPTRCLRQLVIGTFLLPLTILPLFYFASEYGEFAEVGLAALRLAGIILAVSLLAAALRRYWLRDITPVITTRLNGLASLLLGVVVLGLMAALHGSWAEDPTRLWLTIGAAFGANFGGQLVTALMLAKIGARSLVVPIGVLGGNRNIALFLPVLPFMESETALLFIACYQLPMYLTPTLLRRAYSSLASR